jgi:hypothetical protein
MLRELTFDEIEEVSGGSFAAVSAEWINGAGTASAAGFANNYSASAAIAGSISPTSSKTPTLILTAQAYVG